MYVFHGYMNVPCVPMLKEAGGTYTNGQIPKLLYRGGTVSHTQSTGTFDRGSQRP